MQTNHQNRKSNIQTFVIERRVLNPPVFMVCGLLVHPPQ
jgi:hypothetical protein